MKTIYSYLIAVLLSISAFAQMKIAPKDTWIKQSKETAEKIIKESPYIFEGTVIKTEGFIGKDKDFYTSNTIQITEILRGNNDLKLGTIEVITHGGNATYEDPNHTGTTRVWIPCQDCQELHLTQGELRIMFFCVPAEDNLKVLNIKIDNTITLKTKEWYIGYAIAIPQTDGSISWMNLSFKNKRELYDFLSKYDNITIPKEEPIEKKSEDVKPTKAESDSIQQVQNKNLYEQRKKNYEQYMESKMKVIDAKQKKADNTKQINQK